HDEQPATDQGDGEEEPEGSPRERQITQLAQEEQNPADDQYADKYLHVCSPAAQTAGGRTWSSCTPDADFALSPGCHTAFGGPDRPTSGGGRRAAGRIRTVPPARRVRPAGCPGVPGKAATGYRSRSISPGSRPG